MMNDNPAPMNQKANMNAPAASPEVVARPWVVVLNPGQADELVAEEFKTHGEALKFLRFNDDCDVMKRLPDGTLTTEF